ncbi:MAG: hypothetical protein NTY19_42385 [Planctomycetota bacterium]|nr:hypothetical protein [Planctomycetota bacterium]
MFCHRLVVFSLLVAAGNVNISAGAAVPVAELEEIRSAASFEAPAKPKKPRNVLIFSRADGYSALGHQKDVYWRPAILKHYLAGIQFAAGDLEADATPRQAPAQQ